MSMRDQVTILLTNNKAKDTKNVLACYVKADSAATQAFLYMAAFTLHYGKTDAAELVKSISMDSQDQQRKNAQEVVSKMTRLREAGHESSVIECGSLRQLRELYKAKFPSNKAQAAADELTGPSTPAEVREANAQADEAQALEIQSFEARRKAAQIAAIQELRAAITGNAAALAALDKLADACGIIEAEVNPEPVQQVTAAPAAKAKRVRVRKSPTIAQAAAALAETLAVSSDVQAQVAA